MNRNTARGIAELGAPAARRRRPPVRPTLHGSIFVSAALREVRGNAERRARTAGRGRQQGRQHAQGRQKVQAAQSIAGAAPHGQAAATGSRCPLATPVGPSPLPSQLGGGFRPHVPCSTEGQRLPHAAPGPLLPAIGTQKKTPNPLPPPFHQSPSAQARTDSSVTTRPSPAPSLPTTQLPLQQETALVNQCSSPLICVCQAARRGGTRDCESPSIARPAAELAARRTTAGTGRQYGVQEMWLDSEWFGDPPVTVGCTR